MDTPRIALRFRDPGSIDTIEEHRTVLHHEGSVWWGWWKKDTEPFKGELLQIFRSPAPVLLVDRSTRRCFIATCLKARAGDDPEVDSARIPGYYRNKRENVAAWLLLRTIDSSSHDETIDGQFATAGNKTLLHLTGPTESSDIECRIHVERNSILHLSDLHFGSDYSFLKRGSSRRVGESRCTLSDAILADLERLHADGSIGLILVTGDFTTQGDWSDETRRTILEEFAGLRTALGLRPQHIVAVPGNHDVVRYAGGQSIDVNELAVDRHTTYKHEREFRTLLDELTGRDWSEPLNYLVKCRLPEVDLDICVLNSCTIAATNWTEYGYVGVGGYDALKRMKAAVCTRPTYRVAALHHHVLPVSQVDTPSSTGVSLTLDAVELLELASNAGVQIVVHGHKHLARVARYENVARDGENHSGNLTVVSGGSAGVVESRRGFERNTYSLFRLTEDGIHLILRELRPDGKQGGVLFDLPLGVAPISPLAHDVEQGLATEGASPRS